MGNHSYARLIRSAKCLGHMQISKSWALIGLCGGDIPITKRYLFKNLRATRHGMISLPTEVGRPQPDHALLLHIAHLTDFGTTPPRCASKRFVYCTRKTRRWVNFNGRRIYWGGCVHGGPAGLFRDAGFATILDGIWEIAENGIRYTYDTGNTDREFNRTFLDENPSV